MRVFLIAFLLSATALLAHVVLWRLWLPRRQTFALLVIFILALLCGVSALWTPTLAAFQPRGGWEILQIVLFHVAFMLAYVVAYSALEERSPSMTILLRVSDSGPLGTSREELMKNLALLSPVEVRLKAMVRDGMLRQEGEMYRLTEKGNTWIAVFSWWRDLLGFERGG
jgi:hypothetical protein